MGAVCSHDKKHGGPHDPSQDRPVAAAQPARPTAAQAVGHTASDAQSTARHKNNYVQEKKNRVTTTYDMDQDKVGEGTYGVVRKATKKGTSMTRAIKTLSKKEMRNLKMFRVEIQIMKELDHPNIIKLFEVFEDQQSIYLVMELCRGGELFDRIIEAGHLEEDAAAVVVQQILRAVFYMHENQVAHRDLKPENFLLMTPEPIMDNCLKLIDFGFACRWEPGKPMRTKAGTPYYMAPQVLAGRYDHLCDVWSVGAILYTLLCGYPPFNGNSDKETLDKVRDGKYVFKESDWSHISDDAKELISNMMKRNTKERFTAEQAMNHSWVAREAPRKHTLSEVEGWHRNTIGERMRAFRNKNRLKRAALQVIAGQLDDRQLKELREIFNVVDKNGDGTLTLEEITEAATRAGCEIPRDLTELMQAADIDGSGCIDYTEFLAAMLEQRDYLCPGAVKSAFATFDASGRGSITREELAKVLGAGMNDERAIEELLHEVDKDGDGNISFDEFMAMMQYTPSRGGEEEAEPQFMLESPDGAGRAEAAEGRGEA